VDAFLKQGKKEWQKGAGNRLRALHSHGKVLVPRLVKKAHRIPSTCSLVWGDDPIHKPQGTKYWEEKNYNWHPKTTKGREKKRPGYGVW